VKDRRHRSVTIPAARPYRRSPPSTCRPFIRPNGPWLTPCSACSPRGIVVNAHRINAGQLPAPTGLGDFFWFGCQVTKPNGS